MATGTVSLSVTHDYAAPPDRIFDAFLDPAVARFFLFATPDGKIVRAEIDPRVGGRFVLVDRRPGMGDVEHVGDYLEIDRPRRLVFSFGVPAFSPEMSRVAIEIVPEQEGCRLTLTHEGVLPEFAERSREGWAGILAGLLPAYAGIVAAGAG